MWRQRYVLNSSSNDEEEMKEGRGSHKKPSVETPFQILIVDSFSLVSVNLLV